MEDGVQELSTESSLSLQDQAAEGQKYLEATVEAAHEILASLDEVLGNPLLWAQPAPTPAVDASGKPVGGGLPQQEQGWVALETGRLRYKSTSAALRASITGIFSNPQMRLQEGDPAKEKGPAVDLHQLELRAAQLREEDAKKNQMLKVVIDQSRELAISEGGTSLSSFSISEIASGFTAMTDPFDHGRFYTDVFTDFHQGSYLYPKKVEMHPGWNKDIDTVR